MKRTYHSVNRDAQAARTRSLVLKAAKKLFINDGFDRVTIGNLAKAAGVSIPTVYAIFQSKRGVLQALVDQALPPEKFAALVKDAMEERCSPKHLCISAKIARHIYDAEKELMDIMRGASVVAPEFKELEQEREFRRYERQCDSIKLIKQDLAKGITVQKARDILWTLTGRDMYRMLVIEREWSSDQYEKWLADILIKSLLS